MPGEASTAPALGIAAQDGSVLIRAVHGVERIILLSPSGSLSFDAIRWCHEQSITVMLLDRDGQLLECLGPQQPGDLVIRRAQYMAPVAQERTAVRAAPLADRP